MLNQLGDGVDAWPQAGKGEQLGLVEENDASGQVVELAALGGAVGIEDSKNCTAVVTTTGMSQFSAAWARRTVFGVASASIS